MGPLKFCCALLSLSLFNVLEEKYLMRSFDFLLTFFTQTVCYLLSLAFSRILRDTFCFEVNIYSPLKRRERKSGCTFPLDFKP